MAATLTLPALLEGNAPIAILGPVPASTALGVQLQRSLPPGLVEALDKIGDQIATEILHPLVCTGSIEEMTKAFEVSFPRFKDYYTSTVLIMQGFLQEDPQRFYELTVQSFQQSENLIRTSSRWIGGDTSLNAAHGLDTMIRVAKAATRLFDQNRLKGPIDEPCAEQWTNSIIAYVMSLSAVLLALKALANGQPASVKLENVSVLAEWGKSYAVRAYHFAKNRGLLKVAHPRASISLSENEDELLAEAGLESYAEALVRDDQA